MVEDFFKEINKPKYNRRYQLVLTGENPEIIYMNVIPIGKKNSCKKSDVRLPNWKKYQQEFYSGEIKDDDNIAIITGPIPPHFRIISYVIDIDVVKNHPALPATITPEHPLVKTICKNYQLPPPTRILRTGNHGFHLYYYFYNTIDLRNRKLPLPSYFFQKFPYIVQVETRGFGGLVFGPGTKWQDSDEYIGIWEHNGEVASPGLFNDAYIKNKAKKDWHTHNPAIKSKKKKKRKKTQNKHYVKHTKISKKLKKKIESKEDAEITAKAKRALHNLSPAVREGFLDIAVGLLDIRDLTKMTGKPEFLYWKYIYIEFLFYANKPPEVVAQMLAQTQPEYDPEETQRQLNSTNAPEGKKPLSNAKYYELFPMYAPKKTETLLSPPIETTLDYPPDETYKIFNTDKKKTLLLKNINKKTITNIQPFLYTHLTEKRCGEFYKSVKRDYNNETHIVKIPYKCKLVNICPNCAKEEEKREFERLCRTFRHSNRVKLYHGAFETRQRLSAYIKKFNKHFKHFVIAERYYQPWDGKQFDNISPFPWHLLILSHALIDTEKVINLTRKKRHYFPTLRAISTHEQEIQLFRYLAARPRAHQERLQKLGKYHPGWGNAAVFRVNIAYPGKVRFWHAHAKLTQKYKLDKRGILMGKFHALAFSPGNPFNTKDAPATRPTDIVKHILAKNAQHKYIIERRKALIANDHIQLSHTLNILAHTLSTIKRSIYCAYPTPDNPDCPYCTNHAVIEPYLGDEIPPPW